MAFVNEDWTSHVCDTEHFSPQNDGTAKVQCKCIVPGAVAVFLVENKDGVEKLTQVPEVITLEKFLEFT